mgnify:CR=1 FL=1
MDFKTGGQQVIFRLIEAYGFRTRQMLCDHLGVSKSTLATRFMRDIFPAEWVVQCALETGASLQWLTTGQGKIFGNDMTDVVQIKNKKVLDGKLVDSNFCFFYKTMLPTVNEEIFFLSLPKVKHLIETNLNNVSDGQWLISIDNNISLRKIDRIPNDKVKVTNETTNFISEISDLKFIGKVRLSITIDPKEKYEH